jgi:hypothetical protein
MNLMIKEIREFAAQGATFVVSHSGGKDSQALLLHIAQLVPVEQIAVIHVDMKGFEWAGTEAHMRQTAMQCGIPADRIFVRSAAKSIEDKVRDRGTKSLGKESPGFTNRFLLQEWGWDRDRCKAEIAAAGLPLPVKSACFFCPAMKKDEVTALHAKHPQLAARSLEIERLAQQRGLKTIKGLGIQWTWQRHLNFQLTSAAG